LLYDQTVKLTPRRAAAAGKYQAAPPPTKVDQRAAAAEPKHPVRRRRPNTVGVGGLFVIWLHSTTERCERSSTVNSCCSLANRLIIGAIKK